MLHKAGMPVFQSPGLAFFKHNAGVGIRMGEMLAAVRLPRRSGRLGILLTACLLLWLAAVPGSAEAAVTCPNPNPVVDENQCHTGTSSWQVNDYSLDLGGFTTQTSVNLGQSVSLKIARNAPVSSNATVNIGVYRMGYYQNLGGRLVHSANNVAINNNFTCNPMDPTTGRVDCGNWSTTAAPCRPPGSTWPS
jgi:hypothetical protein